MTARRVILELGSRSDLHGGDYTKAAVRAVEDAIRHASLNLLRSLAVDPAAMRVEVTVGVQRPDRIDAARVARALPHGSARVRAVRGGLDVPGDDGDTAVVASAAVAVSLDLAGG